MSLLNTSREFASGFGFRYDRCVVFTPTGLLYLEVQVQDVHLVHVLQPLTDLADEQHRVQLRQVVVLVDDAVKQLAALHTATSAP